ncbi:unnamed protein product [Paramecium sonneborni]|uniref:Uncharacterized protein n=1 Tax=Paramecium sonneborni TaxID=65129 RepID=A0A8S1RR86_9CILI|nr:unnamed protein product [Paramecium sonneborni]
MLVQLAIIKFQIKEKEILFEQVIEYQEKDFDQIRTIKLASPSHKNIDETGEDEILGQYTIVTLIVTDSETFIPIVGATVTMYQDINKCQELNHNVYYPIRIVQTNSTGMISIYNFQMKDKIYFFKFKWLIEIEDYNLALKSKTKSRISFQCSHIDFFFSNCSFMKFSSHPKSQKQNFKSHYYIKDSNIYYIFFACHIPINSDIIEVVNKNGLSLVAKLQAELQKEIAEFQNSQPKISIYTKNYPYPQIYEMPHTLQSEIDTTSDLLIWLSFCTNGKIRPECSTPINHFWEKKDKSKLDILFFHL